MPARSTLLETVWLVETFDSPPFSDDAQDEAGWLLRRIQTGERIGMPHSRPMPAIGPRVHELRVKDKQHTWRIIYRIDRDAIVLVEWYDKNDNRMPVKVKRRCQSRLQTYDEA